jgi:hypothetical protein
MGVRDRVREGQARIDRERDQKIQPLLESGEQIQAVFPTQAGNPWLVVVYGPMGSASFGKHDLAVVTDRNIVLLKVRFPLHVASPGAGRPKAVLARLPRAPLGTPEGRLWGKVMIGGEPHWVVRRFFKDVAAANAVLAA